LIDTFVIELVLTFDLSETQNFVHRFYVKYNNVYTLMFSHYKCQRKFMLRLLVSEQFCLLAPTKYLFHSLFYPTNFIWQKVHEYSTNSDNQV
jgi:hypothetical protein